MIWPLNFTSTSAGRTATTVTPLKLSPTPQTSTALLIVFNIAREFPIVPTSETGTPADIGVTGLTLGSVVFTAMGGLEELGRASPRGCRSGVLQIFSKADSSGMEGLVAGLVVDGIAADSKVGGCSIGQRNAARSVMTAAIKTPVAPVHSAMFICFAFISCPIQIARNSKTPFDRGLNSDRTSYQTNAELRG